MSDSSSRGVLELQVAKGSWWAVRFANRSRNIRVADLKLLPSDAASFEPSQAPLSKKEIKASASESLNRGLSVTASTIECAENQITLKQARWGPRLPRERLGAARRPRVTSRQNWLLGSTVRRQEPQHPRGRHQFAAIRRRLRTVAGSLERGGKTGERNGDLSRPVRRGVHTRCVQLL